MDNGLTTVSIYLQLRHNVASAVFYVLHEMTLYCLHMQAEGKLKGVPICGVGYYSTHTAVVVYIRRFFSSHWESNLVHLAHAASVLPLSYNNRTTTILYMYCTGGTECLSRTPGSHLVCALRTPLGVDWKFSLSRSHN